VIARLIVLILGCLVVAYAPIRAYGFVYEDYRTIQGVLAGGHRVFSWGPRGLSAWLWMADPQASHVLSLGLHVVAGVLTGVLGWRLGLSRLAAVLAAGLLLLRGLLTFRSAQWWWAAL